MQLLQPFRTFPIRTGEPRVCGLQRLPRQQHSRRVGRNLSVQNVLSGFGKDKEIVLPEEISIKYPGSREEVEFLYREVFLSRHYLREGSLSPGNVVLDVGANVGLFSILAATLCPGGRVLAFEPIPPIFQCLQKNVTSLLTVRKQNEVANIECFNFGVSDGKTQKGEFIYYDRAAGWSTMAPDEREVEASMEAYLDGLLRAPLEKDDSFLKVLGKKMQNFGPPGLLDFAKTAFIQNMLNSKKKVSCDLRSVSQIMAEMKLERVDFLKVDVERAELAVLLGVDKSDWPKIRQLAVEVHDKEGRLEKVMDLLQTESFDRISSYQSSDMNGTGIHIVYASRN